MSEREVQQKRMQALKIEKEGAKAWKKGISKSQNPYHGKSFDAFHWAKGWDMKQARWVDSVV